MKASIYFLAKSRRTPEVSPRTSFYTAFVRHPATAPFRENSTPLGDTTQNGQIRF